MTLTNEHYQLLIAACVTCFGDDYEHKRRRFRAEQAQEMIAFRVPILNPSFEFRPLALRLGMTERHGLRLADELVRYGYVKGSSRYCREMTPDGLDVAVAMKHSNVAEGAMRPAVPSPMKVAAPVARSDTPADCCQRCGHIVTTSAAAYCSRCGIRLVELNSMGVTKEKNCTPCRFLCFALAVAVLVATFAALCSR